MIKINQFKGVLTHAKTIVRIGKWISFHSHQDKSIFVWIFTGDLMKKVVL